MSTQLEPGTKAPSFTLEDYTGQQYSWRITQGIRSFSTSIPRHQHPDALKKPAIFEITLPL